MFLVRRTAIAAVLTLCLPSVALAFHSGGIGDCRGCHVLHIMPGGATRYSLRAANETDLCLLCHAMAAGNSWGGDVRTPGPQYGAGAFVYLWEDNLNDGPDGSDPLRWIPGDAAGHSVISWERGTRPDARNPRSPGGNYPSQHLRCTSCHDPHGRGGHYRLLYGSDTGPSRASGYSFNYSAPAPKAVGLDVEGLPESAGRHTAYLEGMSAWCGNCHGRYHDEASGARFRHPIDQPLGPEIAAQYDRYQGTGFAQGTGLDSYLPLVPFEDPSVTPAYRGPTPPTARVSCVSCHRAHASSAPSSLRWDPNITTWRQEGIASGSYPIPNPYPSTAGPAQGSLCQKCHGSEQAP